MPKQNLQGQQFGRLTVLEETSARKCKSVVWICSCVCGNLTAVPTHYLNSGNTKSCGCLRIDLGVVIKKHGKTNTVEYRIWAGMISRCYRQNDPSYVNYGARGISVCDRWKNSFEDFLSDMGLRPDDLTLDRVDNEQGYSPDNCRWATKLDQARNTRTNVFVEVQGKRMTLTEACALVQLPYNTVWNRRRSGKSDEEALGLDAGLVWAK